jgi:hypothetical protein
MAGDAASARIGVRPAAVVAQFGGLGNLLGTGKDFAVKAALSTFGKSLGDQLPIVVAAADAFATVPSLPGAPFAPATGQNIAALLRESRDGTVALPPGDYAFSVGVFCMRATSGSPNAHRYLVAPLHGSAADIITALNSRIPSYSVDHHLLQVLSWDIQAGMAYSAMQPDQRAAVDRIIPEYRSRLNADVYERIRDQYTATTQSIPGMPSFEEALTRIGPVGAQVVALQNLRRQLAQPPPTFEQLARALVPVLPAGSAPNPTGETPWSRYSERVFVRFVTAGNYATPGTYQVRVLPASGAGASTLTPTLFVTANYESRGSAQLRMTPTRVVAAPSAASVPFTNVVNNPGTDTVQPLTQTPVSGPIGSVPRPVPPPPSERPTIISETVAALPPDHHRRVVGVGEQVKLTFSDGPATWEIATVKDGVVGPSGTTVLYTAASESTRETITARGRHGDATIDFDVIAPIGVVARQIPCTVAYHTQGRPDSGMLTVVYLTPDIVSFQYIDEREDDAKAAATGVYAPYAGDTHAPSGAWPVTAKVVPGLGSLVYTVDLAYTGLDRRWVFMSSYAPGYLEWKIPMEYKVRVSNGVSPDGAQWHPFAGNFTVLQRHSLEPDGRTLITSKAGASVKVELNDPGTQTPDQDDKQMAARKACPIKPFE